MGLFDTAKWIWREVRRDGEEPDDVFDIPDIHDVPTAQDAPEMVAEAVVEVDSAELAQLRADNERLTRIKDEFFACIESMERQRDEWKEMYFTHYAEHFCKNGFAVVLFDYRYQGDSDGEPGGQIFP